MGTAAQTLGLQGVDLLAHGANGKLERVPAEVALAGKTIGVYFSAHWCGPCRAFTPTLAQVYEAVKAKHDDFVVLFVSADRNPQQFEEYYKSMPWLAVPFQDRALQQQLSSRFSVMGIPRLVIVGPDGAVIASDARAAVMADEQGEHFPWPGAAGPSLLSALLSPRGLMFLFFILYYLVQWLTKK
ncbi:nucleoredoxin 1 [Chlorella sorokiniana]|jgi:nucleoredoxin|uniref:protein-disulfide reductase n=1 Tax=Chlorella sorokiniana TaxID=3076 RepID=A0A2P6TX90_CHLSO|nr:nucleoredoxin 1 [Chlorella sorokiniana]|eukprot:PRW58685.1 nucleoredoxin 1 [Chlorella sorokiniana]